MQLSVIIPTLNESTLVGFCINSLKCLKPYEVIVVDGGSEDNTVSVATNCGAKVILSPMGRGIQLHMGAMSSKGDVLIFLHADGKLYEGIDVKDIEECLNERYCGGFFALRFDDPRLTVRLVEFFANLRSRLFQLPYGDQALFIKREAYEAVGGFRDYPFLEDLDMAIRLKKMDYKLKAFRHPVVVSARRFRNKGLLTPIIKSLRNVIIALLYILGVSPYKLVRLYR